MNLDTIKNNFDKNLWTKSMVAVAVKKGIIDKNGYKKITGEAYKEQK